MSKNIVLVFVVLLFVLYFFINSNDNEINKIKNKTKVVENNFSYNVDYIEEYIPKIKKNEVIKIKKIAIESNKFKEKDIFDEIIISTDYEDEKITIKKSDFIDFNISYNISSDINYSNVLELNITDINLEKMIEEEHGELW